MGQDPWFLARDTHGPKTEKSGVLSDLSAVVQELGWPINAFLCDKLHAAGDVLAPICTQVYTYVGIFVRLLLIIKYSFLCMSTVRYEKISDSCLL